MSAQTSGRSRGVICLQGGAEFQPGCEQMDAAVVADALVTRGSSSPRLVVLPFAGRPGREREIAGANAERWYRGLGVQDAATVLDEDDAALPDAVEDADLVVLPGGSPSRLLDALRPHAALLGRALARGTAISGASAGAMVLCRWTVLPQARPHIVPGLGIADVDLVLPHFRGSTGWLDGARQVLPDDTVALGLPERSGMLLRADGSREAVGVEPCTELAVHAR